MKFEYLKFEKVFEFEFVFEPSKFDFQIPTGLNSAKSVLSTIDALNSGHRRAAL